MARRRIHEADLHDDLLAQMRNHNTQAGVTNSHRYHKALDNAIMSNKIQGAESQFSNAAAQFSAQFQAMSDAMRDPHHGVGKGNGGDD